MPASCVRDNLRNSNPVNVGLVNVGVRHSLGRSTFPYDLNSRL